MSRSWFSTPLELHGEKADSRAGAENIPSEPGISCMPESKEALKQTKQKTKARTTKKHNRGSVSDGHRC